MIPTPIPLTRSFTKYALMESIHGLAIMECLVTLQSALVARVFRPGHG